MFVLIKQTMTAAGVWVVCMDDGSSPSELPHDVLAVASSRELAMKVMVDALGSAGCKQYISVAADELIDYSRLRWTESEGTISVTYGRGSMSNPFCLTATQVEVDAPLKPNLFEPIDESR